MMRGDRKARGASRRMCGSPWASRSEIPAKDAMRPSLMSSTHPRGLGDCSEQSVTAFGPHCRFCARRMNNALHGREAWRGPCERDRGRQGAARSGVLEAGVFGLRQNLTRGNEADFQCLKLDDHARDMVLDQVRSTSRVWGSAASIAARCLRTLSHTRVSISVAGTQAMLPASALRFCKSACDT